MPTDEPGNAVLTAQAVHFVGIAGTGMQALAEVLLARGTHVSGSDSRSSETLCRLRSLGAMTFADHAAEQVGPAEAVVYSAAIPADNPELVEAQRRNLPTATHADVLGALSAQLQTVAIAGTAGKSTTTALAAHLICQSGLDPVYLGGAHAPDLGGSGRAGRGSVLVVEADEFARRFLHLHPSVAVITNVEPDHLDYYGSFENVQAAFVEFAQRVAPDGLIAASSDGPLPEPIAGDPRLVRYGFTPKADWQILDYAADAEGSHFIVHRPDGGELAVRLRLHGEHNAANATAALIAACRVGASVDRCLNALASFQGVRRRFDTVGRARGVWIVDDYAHHPTKVRAALRAAREAHRGRVWAVFQPHTAHRTLSLMDDFAKAFGDADRVVLLPIYHPTGREPEDVQVTVADLTATMHHPGVCEVDSHESAIALLLAEVVAGDLVLTMGAGDVTELGPRLLDRLNG